MKRRVLWIEDSAHNENARLSSPVYLSGRYSLTTVLTATDGMEALADEVYDAIIVDIRILPGDHKRWISEYTDRGNSLKAARLGLKLLEVVLNGSAGSWCSRPLKDAAREAHRFGVLSVEAKESLAADLARLNVTAYRNKNAAANSRVLLELFDEVITRTPQR